MRTYVPQNRSRLSRYWKSFRRWPGPAQAMVLFVLLVIGVSAFAEPTAKAGNDTVRLTESPCPASVLRHIPEGYRGYFRLANATIQGRGWLACHAPLADGTVMIVYEDGDQTQIPMAAFHNEPGV